MKRIVFLLIACLSTQLAQAQEMRPMTLKQCLSYSLENSSKLEKDRLGAKSANQSRREIIGSLLPQINASGQFTYNIDKTTIAMPNFVNSMMPEPMRDPNASKYMTVTMGMDLSANWGLQLTQQLLNFSLFNTVKITKVAEEMAELGIKADTEEVIAKTAKLYYIIQIMEYSLSLFDQNLEIMGKMADVMETNRNIGLVKAVDADRIAVARTNLETQKMSIQQALEVQKNLLKLEMGMPMDGDLQLQKASIEDLEDMAFRESVTTFSVEDQMSFKLLKEQQNILGLQKKSAVSETLPMLSLSGTYSQNYMGDHFYGETFHHFPMSMVSLNLRMPIFTGMSKNARIKKAEIEIAKAREDEKTMTQALTMGYNNAREQMNVNRSTIVSQKRNKELSENVMEITRSNYNEGIATMSDFLNAASGMINAQMNYVTAVGNCISAYIDLKKAEGTIMEINRQ